MQLPPLCKAPSPDGTQFPSHVGRDWMLLTDNLRPLQGVDERAMTAGLRSWRSQTHHAVHHEPARHLVWPPAEAGFSA